jgi:hypothetical protein
MEHLLMKSTVAHALASTEPNKRRVRTPPPEAALGEGAAGAGTKQVQQATDAPVAFEFALFVPGQSPFLIFQDEFVHAISVTLAEVKLQEGTRARGRQVALLRLDNTGKDGCFAVRRCFLSHVRSQRRDDFFSGV